MHTIAVLAPIIIILVILTILNTIFPIGLWITALFSGVNVGLGSLIGMRLRRVSPSKIINPSIKATKAGIKINIGELEAHYLAGGNVNTLVDALIAAQRANIDLEFHQAAAIDLAGRNVLEAVQVSVNPKVIETPNISAVAQDGIEVLVKAKVTVRADIDKLVGGANEQTIIARVGEGIVTTVGSSESYKKILENPDAISKTVLEKGLDSGTAFEILSIDIADVDVGRNIGAQLQTDQAEADKKIAEAKASERKAMAKAREQEMVAEVQAMKAKVVEAEAKVPEAMARALETGKLGVLDYYKMNNIKADTSMREGIARKTDSKEEKWWPMIIVILVALFNVFIFLLPFIIIGVVFKDKIADEIKEAKEEMLIKSARKDSQKIKGKSVKEVDACEGSVIRDELLENWQGEKGEIKEEIKEEGQSIEGIFHGLSEEEILVVASEIFQQRYWD